MSQETRKLMVKRLMQVGFGLAVFVAIWQLAVIGLAIYATRALRPTPR